jgi:glycosyltransferase involved in cell wall biosynthesis
MTGLSVLIPARNEQFLSRTVADVLANMRGDSEVIVIADGAWPGPPLPEDKRITLVYHPQPIGQRAATNEAARISTAKYIMKLDAHCAVDEGFDIELMADCQPDWTVVPRMYNLHVFDWKCLACGRQTYQGPQPETCADCNGSEFEQVIVWQHKNSASDFMWFDKDLVFRYFDGTCLKPYGHDIKALKKRYDHARRDWAQGDIADQMTALGACWFMERERFWQLDGLDEGHGSWGQMGVEIACKSWLSGGRQVVNKKTWFAHMFRTKQGPKWGFPYPNPPQAVSKARERSKTLWVGNSWPKATRPLSWLVEHFSPLPGWDELPIILRDTEPAKGIIYYTDNRLDDTIANTCRRQLLKAGLPIVSASLQTLDFGTNITLDLERGILTMFKQILAALQVSRADVVYFCEHDVLYHPSHFHFTPPTADDFYYNENVWKVDAATGLALFYFTRQTSGLCCYRDTAIDHYQKRIRRIELERRYDRAIGFEPGCHQFPRGIDGRIAKSWMSEMPNIDIRHKANLTPSRWSRDKFRNQKNCQGWTEAQAVPGWGDTWGRFDEFLSEVV